MRYPALLSIEPLHDLVLKPVTDVYWEAKTLMQCRFVTDEGVYLSTLKPGFISDLRSGCDLINPIIPKWGNQKYTWCIVGGHDCSFHGYLSFGLANDLFLRQGLALSGQIGQRRASLAAWTVDHLGESHYSSMDDELEPPYEGNRALCKIELLPR